MFRQIIVFTRFKELEGIKKLTQSAHPYAQTIELFNPFGQSPVELMAANKLNGSLVALRTSGVLFDDWDLELAQKLHNSGAQLTHSLKALKILRSKQAQFLYFIENNLPCVDTLIHRGVLTAQNLEKFYNTNSWVLKPTRGNKGIGVDRYETCELIERWQKQVDTVDQRYIIQPYIDACEIRCLVLGKHSYYLEKKIRDDSKSSWKKNASEASFHLYNPDSSVKKQIDQITQKIGQELSIKTFALDLFITQEGPKIIECNAHPGLNEASKVIKADLYDQFWQAFVN